MRNGGKYDGRLGILVPMACVRELHRAGRRLPFGIEVVGFAEEEGQRYKATFLGSGALTGDFDPAWLDQQDADGVSHARGDAAAGLPATMAAIRALQRDPARYLGFVEVHIEQGPVLDELDLPLGVVTSINGSVRYLGEVVGQASHAGTTPMDRRRDAACAVAELALFVEKRAGCRARRGRHGRHAARCRPARSTSCPGAAGSAWTCAPPPTPRATRWPPTWWPSWSASAPRAAWRITLERTLARRRRAQRAGLAARAGKPPWRRSACRCSACPAAPATTR